MLVRQCVHLLFLALDLHNDDDGQDASDGADADMSDLRADGSGHSDAYYAGVETCQQVASDMVNAMDLGLDDSSAPLPAPPASLTSGTETTLSLCASGTAVPKRR